jgi:hypothetical protein
MRKAPFGETLQVPDRQWRRVRAPLTTTLLPDRVLAAERALGEGVYDCSGFASILGGLCRSGFSDWPAFVKASFSEDAVLYARSPRDQPSCRSAGAQF